MRVVSSLCCCLVCLCVVVRFGCNMLCDVVWCVCVWFVCVCVLVCAIMCLCMFVCEMWSGMLLFRVPCCALLSLFVCVICDISCVVAWRVLLCFVVFVCPFLLNECSCVFGL